MRISPNYKRAGTHIPTLLKVIPLTTGDVCEMGAGFNSTPILHWLCQGRKLVTYENDQDYFRLAHQYQTNNHRIRKVDDWKEVDFDRHWGVVFIDHSYKGKGFQPEGLPQRGDDVLKFKNVDIFILHDTEPEEEEHYHYNLVFPHFKYRYDWKETKPWTSVISNTIDVTKWNSAS